MVRAKIKVEDNIYFVSIMFSFVLMPQYLSETEYSSESEIYRMVVTMKSSTKFVLLYLSLISIDLFKWEKIINKNTEFVTLHGSGNTPFVYILCAEYSDI